MQNPHTFSNRYSFPSFPILFFGSIGAMFGICKHPIVEHIEKMIQETPKELYKTEGKSIGFEFSQAFKNTIGEKSIVT